MTAALLSDSLLSDSQLFARLLRTHRDRARLTQEELAERARMSVRALRDLERGRTRFPHRTSILRLATALELSGEDRVTFETGLRRVPAAPPFAPPPWEPPAVSDVVPLALVPLLREVEETVSAASGGGEPAVVAVTGAPGTGALGTGAGRTTFAVQCAHVLRVRLGVRAVFVDLAADRREPEELRAAVRREHLDRTLGGQRCLLLADGAASAAQVRPLLALGFTGVLVTSGAPLPGLAVTRRVALEAGA
ncbi:Helix-turn-helix domain protein [Nonomuraea coxensis DSM 45129]|uniref:Helix-turn-helix domain protein n=1 Tax=Nonomuraea coxensis DSM 45129 TaxID=1122611 RepID=A0ABX8U4P2_9ACTN|nr:helix-turn-helix transcriptional regulator [Nonomuraea coxensis]QYC41607.1 Helix-turn-helix domain protein [Nonomuraea coxensis DSM 45129]